MIELKEKYFKEELEPDKYLSHLIMSKRLDRPDEWSIDELARKALDLEKENKRLMQQISFCRARMSDKDVRAVLRKMYDCIGRGEA